MQLDQFVYGLFNGRGYRIVKSKGVDKRLSDDSLQTLIKRIEAQPGAALLPMHWPTENTLTLTRVVPVTDEYGRQGVWSHTIVASVNDFVWHLQPFLQRAPTDTPPKMLEAIKA